MANVLQQAALDYQRVEKAITFIEHHFHQQPSLHDIAKSVHVSEHHFQRLFSRWVGISPKRFLQYLTKEHAKNLLQNSMNLLDVTYETGLSSPGRLHDLFVQCEAVTPGEFKNSGEGLVIEYGVQPTPFGSCLIATTARGICALSFVADDRVQQELAKVRKRWSSAEIVENHEKSMRLAARIFHSQGGQQQSPLHIYLKGTNFQIKVWEALLRIPYGAVVAYEQIAEAIGKPSAVRAVANAIAQNPVPFLIPCHRVIRKIGDFGGYQGGTARKKAILGWEAARSRASA